jgi:hypothetical protein
MTIPANGCTRRAARQERGRRRDHCGVAGKFGIAVISPPLDDAGNSVRAQRAITSISNTLGGNPYAVRPEDIQRLRETPTATGGKR